MNTLKRDLEQVDLPCRLKRGEEELTSAADLVSDALNVKTQAAREFIRVALANAILMDRKQQDYGPRNISSFGLFGIIVRMNDKMERLKTLISNRKRRAQNESIQDTLRDISNYGILALLVDIDRWPSE